MNRIFVLQFKRMGELLLTTPALAALRKHYPDSHITLALDSSCRELLPAFSYINDSFICSRKDGNRAFWQKLIFTGFDICLDFTANERSAICSILSKAHHRITFQSVSKSPLRPICYNAFVDSSARENHCADHYLNLLRPLNIGGEGSRIALDLPEWALKKSRQILEEIKVDSPYILIHPGTTRPDKCWIADRWSEVIDFCSRELRMPCIVTGSADTFESEHISHIKPKTPFYDLSGRTDLLSLGALIKRASLLISVDSVAMHLGAAFGTPQVALFGKTNPFHWRPRHTKAVVVQAGRQQPNPVFTPQSQSQPMSEISTNQVIDAIRFIGAAAV